MILLDTHALIWWVNGDRKLSTRAAEAIESELTGSNGQILVSAISAWEIAMLIAKGRLALGLDVDEWLDTVDQIDTVRFVAITRQLAVQSTRLPGNFHPDPADRLIVALARHLSVDLLTSDFKIRSYGHVKTIW